MSKSRDDCGNDLASKGVFVVKRGLIGFGWACAPKGLSPAEVEAALDAAGEFYIPAMHGDPPTPWTVARRKHADPTLISPGLCRECEDREHWFLLGGISAVMLLAMDPAAKDDDDIEALGFDPELRIRDADDITVGSA